MTERDAWLYIAGKFVKENVVPDDYYDIPKVAIGTRPISNDPLTASTICSAIHGMHWLRMIGLETVDSMQENITAHLRKIKKGIFLCERDYPGLIKRRELCLKLAGEKK